MTTKLKNEIESMVDSVLRDIVELRGKLNSAKTECNRLTDSGNFADRRKAQDMAVYIDLYFEVLCCRQAELDCLERFYSDHSK